MQIYLQNLVLQAQQLHIVNLIVEHQTLELSSTSNRAFKKINLDGTFVYSDCTIHYRAKTETILPFFHSGGHKTNFKALFGMLTLGHICCSFTFVLGMASIKNPSSSYY